MRKNIYFVILTISVVTLLYFLSLETVVPIPPDENHMDITDEIICFDCHGEDKEYPRKKEHPPKDQCFKCHKLDEDYLDTQE
jgi:hypothetical protein